MDMAEELRKGIVRHEVVLIYEKSFGSRI